MYAPKFAAAGIFFLAISSSFVSCQSNQDSLDNNALETEIEQNKERQNQAETAQIHADYAAFKADANLKIADNERKIASLKVKLSNTDGEAPLDNLRASRIESLEKQNAGLRLRLDQYESNPTEWEKFKSEFNHDMNNFQKAFDDLGKDNVNK